MNFFKQLFCRHEGRLEHILDVHGDAIFSLPRNTRSMWECPKCGKILYKEYLERDIIYVPDTGMGDVSDGYHTFNELYDHRAWLFATICREHKDLAWKSKLHHDGSMYDGMFIVGINTPLGQATYHYDIEPYWWAFNIKELDKAPEWDGHTPKQALDRIYSLAWLKTDIDKFAEETIKMLMAFCDDDNQISIKKCELEVNMKSILEEKEK